MAYTYELMNPSPIENAEVKKRYRDGVHNGYTLKPITGYVMHDKGYDHNVLDEETMEETGEVILGFRTAEASVAANYDFVANPREFYCVLENEMPEGSELFGGGDNNHEVM